MNKSLSQMSNRELCQYLSENRNDEKKFSQALELLMSRKTENFKYPPASEMEKEEIEAIFQAKLNQKQ
ncbi:MULTISPECIES: DUF6887 family protein [unclassified Okeania]|uniref:DUF6887 family protein n=1 Tax=unclassified Okeania TaxID=2634635 RepID=UPI0013BDD25B|nr:MULTISPECIES: hypothetical protein [unclassified Okeania]NEP08075.1 hypothetical protein [Okeania sp. SIO4D6]NEP41456.1 hypothetical protein [Okeania sp. SIO2H7]NET16034.1 hypothetical protein [Okeania sp. SIO1H6]NEP70465.1 hypothetical protein [Okeania sp. SIO2G5]NEP92667.1 hypothetical protein [Okeania sp. SIO2F5]